MDKEDDDIDMIKIMIEAQKKSYRVAFETAVRTGTCLIYNRNGKIVKIKPPYKYVLVPIKKKKRKRKSLPNNHRQAKDDQG